MKIPPGLIQRFITLVFLFLIPVHLLADDKIKVLIIDGYSNHDWAYTTEIISSLLLNSDLCEVSISTAPEKDDNQFNDWNPSFKSYDVIIQNSNNINNDNQWPAKAKKAFEKYMKSGGGMYVYHSGNNAFKNWDEYNNMIGLGWRQAGEGDAIEILEGQPQRIPAGEGPGTSHGPRQTLLVKNLVKHPINKGYPEEWLTPDCELYVYARGPAKNLTVLSYTYDEKTDKNWPVDWVVSYGNGRIFNSTTGHLWHNARMPESIQCIAFQTTFMRAIEWLAGREITTDVPDDFPTALKTSLREPQIIYRPEDGWKSLFNGDNLEGWYVECRPQDRSKVFWSAKDGSIECNSLGKPEHDYYWLMNENEFGDFQLRLEFQIFKDTRGNSGVQFRSRYDKSDEISGDGWLNGPQSDIHAANPLRAGLIYDETRGAQRWIHPSLPDWQMVPEKAPKSAHQTVLYYADDNPDAWNTMEIICQGMEIRTFVNGHRVTKFNAAGILDDESHRSRNVGSSGQIALQLHKNDEVLIRFRNIYARELNHPLSNR